MQSPPLRASAVDAPRPGDRARRPGDAGLHARRTRLCLSVAGRGGGGNQRSEPEVSPAPFPPAAALPGTVPRASANPLLAAGRAEAENRGLGALGREASAVPSAGTHPHRSPSVPPLTWKQGFAPFSGRVRKSGGEKPLSPSPGRSLRDRNVHLPPLCLSCLEHRERIWKRDLRNAYIKARYAAARKGDGGRQSSSSV